MPNWTVALAIVFGLSASGPLSARCAVAADPWASVKTIDPQSQTDANLIIAMSMLPKLVHMDYAEVLASKPVLAGMRSCNLGNFSFGAEAYQLYGADDEQGKVRVAIPVKKGDPVATLSSH